MTKPSIRGKSLLDVAEEQAAAKSDLLKNPKWIKPTKKKEAGK